MDPIENGVWDGLRLSSGVLYVDSSKWTFRKDIELVGESGLSYSVDYFGYNARGERFIVLDGRKGDGDELERALTVVAMKADLKVSQVFVVVPTNVNADIYEADGVQNLTIPVKDILYTAQSDLPVNGNAVSPVKKGNKFNEGSGGQKRDKLTVIINIMELLDSGGSGITNIIYKCNLNYKTASRIIDEMVEKGYIRTLNEKGAKKFSITDSGMDALVNMRNLVTLRKKYT